MVKQAMGTDLDPIDRLEEKVKLLVNVISQLRAERAHALEQVSKLSEDVNVLRARLVDAEHSGSELSVLREERDAIRTRVSDMLQQLEGI